jgi:adenylate cyclase
VTSVEEFNAAGLYDPAEHSTTGRLELLQWLDELGFTVAEMQVGLATESLRAMAGDQRLLPGERLGRAQAIDMAGMAPAEFDMLATALGMVPIDGAPDGEIGFTADEVGGIAAVGALLAMFSMEEAASFYRVVGSAVGRLGEAAVSLFLSDVESRMLADGSTEIEIAHKVYDAIGLLDGVARWLDPLLRRQVVQAIERSRRTMVSNEERYEYFYAVGFVDLVGFTATSGEMGPQKLSGFLRDFEGRAYDVITRAGARVVKLIGDEVMFVADDPSAACSAASELMSGFGARHEEVFPRGGLAYGKVLVRGGDYYGPVVNLASRLADEAVPLELLVTQELADASSSCQFDPAGRRMVKGFAEPITVQSLRR